MSAAAGGPERSAEAILQRAWELHRRGRLAEAERAYRDAIAVDPTRPLAHYNRGVALAALGRHGEAADSYRRVLALDAGHARALNALGNALKALGRLAEARSALEQAVALAPDNGFFHRDLADSKRFAEGDPQLAAMADLARDPARAEAEQTALQFALGKAFADIGRHDDAFRAWSAANALQARRGGYNEALMLRLFARVAEIFTPALIESRKGVGHPSPLPVLIIGMPRSGTTLVEQIVARHPRAFGAGEIPDLALEAARLGGAAPFTEKVWAMDEAAWRALGERYAERLRRRAPMAARITDKMPSNFLFAGLIHLALPAARIIHVRRDPVDTCLSCFSHHFPDAPQTCDLGALGRYCRAYLALMAHWRRVLPPGVMLEVDYEAVVADLEGKAREIIAHCGLDWDVACLDYATADRPVETLSATQVRQPIYRSAVGRAAPYRHHLQPLLAALGAEVG